MNKKNGSKSGMFMMEMIAVVFFFVLCAGICIQVFVRADHMSRLAQDKNKSVNAAQSIAEYLHGATEEEFVTYFKAEQTEPGQICLYWDAQWSRTQDKNQAAYVAQISCEQEEGMSNYHISFTRAKQSDTIYSLDTSVYRKDS